MKFKFRTLVNRHQQEVYSLAYHILKRRDEAEDVAQEVYIKLWRNIDNIDTEKAKSWLLTVTRNQCIDVIRARKPEDDVDDLVLESEEKQAQPAAALEHSRLSEWLKKAIASLKEPYRSLIVMNDVEQHPQTHTAEVMGLTSNQVKVYVHRARQQLRTILQEVNA